MKILHCADIHLGSTFSYLASRSSQRQNELLFTFENIITLCKTEKVQLLIILGDLFENTCPSLELVQRVQRLFESIKETFIVISAGNHDCFSSDSPYAKYNFGKNVHIFSIEWKYITLEKENIRLWGRSFSASYRFNAGLENIKVPSDDKYTNIMVLHADIVNEGLASTSRYCPITLEQLANTNMDYIALGHIHKRTEILKTGYKTFYAYSGCPEGRDFGETGEKGVYIGEIKKNICNLKFYKTSYRMCINVNIDISGLKTEEQIIKNTINFISAKYGVNYSQNLYQVNLTGIAEKIFNTDYILASLKNKVYDARLNNNIRFNVDVINLSDENTLKGCFVRKMLERIETANSDLQKEMFQKSLYKGLEAFEGKVSIYEN